MPALSRAMRSDGCSGKESRGKVSSTFTPASMSSATVLRVEEPAKTKCLVSNAIPRNNALASTSVGLTFASVKNWYTISQVDEAPSSVTLNVARRSVSG